MSYENNLGRVRGDKGYSFLPTIREDTAQHTIITWTCTDENVAQADYPADITIEKLFFIPHVNNNGDLIWNKSNNSEIFRQIQVPATINIKGEKGETGQTNIDVKVYPSLEDLNDKDTSTLYYVGSNGDYTVYVYDDDIDDYRKVGLSSLDLSNYYTKAQSDEKFATKQYVDTEISDKIASALDLIDNSIIPKLG